MGIYIDRNAKILIQGISGEKGLFYASQMLLGGAQIVAGVSPGNGGEWVCNQKIPVFDTVDTAIDATGADASLVFVPVRNAFDAILEAVWADIPVIFCHTFGIPTQDVISLKEKLVNRSVKLIGPGSPGMITSDGLCLGFIPPGIYMKGNVGVVSRSGPIAYEVIFEMMQSGIGISSYIGIGDAPIVGVDFIEILESFELDPATEKILIIGERGTAHEEKAANYIADHITKPIIGYVAGKKGINEKESAISKSENVYDPGGNSVDQKIEALKSAGVKIAALPNDIPDILLSV
jgi:succinyl-CoA synthetase alpha subunit